MNIQQRSKSIPISVGEYRMRGDVLGGQPRVRRFSCLCAAFLLVATASSAAAQGRFTWPLDDGSMVFVDNYSSGSNSFVGNLVRQADRSTKDGGMFLRVSPTKGLFGPGDRIFINNQYLAWFDYSSHGGNAQGGTLAGIWTLSVALQSFKHQIQLIPGVFWAHNELIRGSASPFQQQWVWDLYAPPIEHSVGFPVPGIDYTLLAGHELGRTAPFGNWRQIYDGANLGEIGIVYGTATRLTLGIPGGQTRPVDITDFDDSNGIANYIDSELYFIARANDIRVVWRFKPALAPANSNLAYYHIWAGYSFSKNDPACPGQVWPDQVWNETAHFQSSLPSNTDDLLQPVGAQQFVPLNRQAPVCVAGPSQAARIRRTGSPSNGDWIRWGENAALADGTLRWKLTHVDDGNYGLPGVPISWNHLIFINEHTDGVWGGGAGRFAQTYLPQTWYSTSYTISTQ